MYNEKSAAFHSEDWVDFLESSGPLPAEILRISPKEHEALVTVLEMLKREECQNFWMLSPDMCIMGQARNAAHDFSLFREAYKNNSELFDLFFSTEIGVLVTKDQKWAARTLEHFLNTGRADWEGCR